MNLINIDNAQYLTKLIEAPNIKDAELIRLLYLTNYIDLSDVKKWCDNLIEFTENPDIRIIELTLEKDHRTINTMLLNICNKEESIKSFKEFIEFLKKQKFDTEEKIRKIITSLVSITFPYIDYDIESDIEFVDQMFGDTLAEVFPYQFIYRILPEWFERIDEFYFSE